MTENYSTISWLKNTVRRNRAFKIDIDDLYDYFERIEGRDPETICQNLNYKLSKEGIIIKLGYKNDTDKPSFLFSESSDYKKIELTDRYEDVFKTFLEDHKLYKEQTRKLVCPICYHYSVKFFNHSNNQKWWCDNCLEDIEYNDFNLNLDDNEKFRIYKLWGVDALSMLINEPLKKTIKFVSEHFRSCCMIKKDKCLYFDFFKENKQ